MALERCSGKPLGQRRVDVRDEEVAGDKEKKGTGVSQDSGKLKQHKTIHVVAEQASVASSHISNTPGQQRERLKGEEKGKRTGAGHQDDGERASDEWRGH